MGDKKCKMGLSQRVFSRIIDVVLRHSGKVVVLAILLTILSVVTIAVKFDIRSDVKDLMPQDVQVVRDLYKISDRMGSITTLKLYIKVPELMPLDDEQKAGDEYRTCAAEYGQNLLLRDKPIVGENWCDNSLMLFSRELAARLTEMDTISTVDFIKNKSFFENNLLLYASEEELEQAYEEIDKNLTEARRQSGEYKACLLTSDDASECDALKPGMKKKADSEQGQDAISSFKNKLMERYAETELAAIREFPFYAIQDGGWLVALDIRFKDSTAGLKSVKREIERIDRLIEEIGVDKYNPDIVIEYGGSFNDMNDEYNAIVTDIVRSISVTILSIFGLIALFFMSFRAAARIFGPIVMSTLWSLGVAFIGIGYLNLITAFIFAILIGLGIDFGIHLYARYNVERLNGHDVDTALKISIVQTGSPLFFGALTTAAAFFALMFGKFSGFSQFGFVAGIGVLIAFMTMTTVMPAFVRVMERWIPSKIRKPKDPRRISASARKKVMAVMAAVSILMLVCAGYCGSRIPNVQFEDNFYNLQLKAPENVEKKVKTEQFVQGARPSSPVVAVLDNTDQVEELELLIKRDREYRDFQNYRRVLLRSGNLLERVTDPIANVMPYTGQTRSLPMYMSILRTLPENRRYSLPLFVTYGSEKSRSLRLYRELAIKMPAAAARIAGLAPEIIESNRVADGLPMIVKMQSWLPEWLWPALPTQRSSQQLNTISEFASIFSFLPGTEMQQAERLAMIEKIRQRTSDRNIRFLPNDEKERIRALRKYFVTAPLTIDDLPEWVKMQFKEGGKHPMPPREGSGVDYAFGNIAVLYQATSTYNGIQAEMLTRDARSIRIDGKPLTVATGAFVYADMLRLVKTDGVQISVIALLVILFLAVIQQRRLFPALIVTLPVISGIMITMALMIRFDMKLGLFNIVMLPVTMGIGIDGAIYLYERYRQLGRGSCLASVRAVIWSVFMSSATTLVGFGGMIMSRHMGLNSMGALAILGISTCFFATFLIQPGLIVIAEKLGIRSVVPAFDYDPDAEKGDAKGGEDPKERCENTEKSE